MSHNAFSSCWQDETPSSPLSQREREEKKYISSPQTKILTFSTVKIKCEKENTNIKTPGFVWVLFCFLGFF